MRAMTAHWPDDVVEVAIVDEDVGPRAKPAVPARGRPRRTPRNRGRPRCRDPIAQSVDPYLQLQDRALLVPDEAHRKDLWRVLGRPGAIVHDGEIVGTWRPRATAKTFRLTAMAWRRLPVGARRAVTGEAERLRHPSRLGSRRRGVGLTFPTGGSQRFVSARELKRRRLPRRGRAFPLRCGSARRCAER